MFWVSKSPQTEIITWIVAAGSKNRVLEAKSLTDLKLIFLDVEPLSKLALYEHTHAQIHMLCCCYTCFTCT